MITGELKGKDDRRQHAYRSGGLSGLLELSAVTWTLQPKGSLR